MGVWKNETDGSNPFRQATTGFLRWFWIPPVWTQKQPEATLGWVRRKLACPSEFGSEVVILMKIPPVECNCSGLKRIVLTRGPPPPGGIIFRRRPRINTHMAGEPSSPKPHRTNRTGYQEFGANGQHDTRRAQPEKNQWIHCGIGGINPGRNV
jgi:hypothetical protein